MLHLHNLQPNNNWFHTIFSSCIFIHVSQTYMTQVVIMLNITYCLYMKSLYFLMFLLIPRMEPTAATTETRKHTKLNSWSTHHFNDNLLICFCAMCICMGKNTMRGQNPIAPRRARNSLKNGMAMAIVVATATYIVLQISLKRLTLNVKGPIFVGYSLFMKSERGHTMLAPISIIRNSG